MHWFREFFKSEYTRFLEGEVERLRGELREWQNATLYQRNLPPLSIAKAPEQVATAAKPRNIGTSRLTQHQHQSSLDRAARISDTETALLLRQNDSYMPKETDSVARS